MSSQCKHGSGTVPFHKKLKEAAQVGFGLFTFCLISIAGLSTIVWLTLLALDPAHSAINAALRVADLARIPLGVTTGMSIFFAAVTWDSAGIRAPAIERSSSPASSLIPYRRTVEHEREVS